MKSRQSMIDRINVNVLGIFYSFLWYIKYIYDRIVCSNTHIVDHRSNNDDKDFKDY